MLKESEADRAARGEQIESLTLMLKESEADRAARGEQIESLTLMLKESEADRAKRAEQIEQIQNLSTELRILFSRSGFRWLTRCVKWPELEKLGQQIGTPANKSLKTIAVDLTPVLPGGENGGAKIFVLELLRQLAAMAPQTQFVLLTHAKSHQELAVMDRRNMRRVMVVGPAVANFLRPRLRGLVSRVLPYLPARLRRAVSRIVYGLNRMLKRSGSGTLFHDLSADLLFCPFTAPTYFEPGIPTVCTIFDLQYKTYPEFFAAEDVTHRDRAFIEACRRATGLITISDYSRDTAIFHGSLNPGRIRTIHPRMAQRFLPRAAGNKELLRRLGLTLHRYFIYPANFWKHKNHEMLLTAFGIASYGRLATDIKLVCTGAPGVRQEWLIRAVHSMNLGDRVSFPGYLPDVDLGILIGDSCGVIFPSLYEGFGLPIIEAMAMGVPVACSNTTSLPEVATDAAILFDPRIPTQIAQAMVSLAHDEALRARLIQAGRQRAAKFSDSKRMAREYWEIFQDALVNEKRQNLLIGAYADGWVGRTLNIQAAPAESAQTLELEFSAPDWLPQPSLTVQVIRGGNQQSAPLQVVRGATAVLSLPLESAGGDFEIRISPTFVPAHSGYGDDQRELSMMLQRCGIVRTGSEYIELIPERNSA
jgi:glycosyltransferase involved in cell wall biosynthesis